MTGDDWITGPSGGFEATIGRLAERIADADAVLVGAGAGLSTAAGLSYSGERFERHFADFAERFSITDMYSGGFHRFPDPETYWAWWSRQIWINRYDCPVGRPYLDLLEVVRGRDHFVLTTNVDHQFQRAGFDRERLFYTQGDYGLWQCSLPCHQNTYDNYETVAAMVEQQHDLRVPSGLLPYCPVCGRPMSMNLRADDTFVQDAGWDAAADRYAAYRRERSGGRIVYLEVGVGQNTPGIIKYPFWQAVATNPQATYAQLNLGEARVPAVLAGRSITVDADAGRALAALREALA